MASDYSPPRLVKPTPGGNPGDGSMDGALTFLQGKTFPGTAPANKTGILYADSIYGECWLSTPSWLHLQDGPGTGRIKLGLVGIYLGIFTQGMGIVPIFGLDNRTGLTAVDGAPITLYTTTASGQLYRLSGRVLATAGTSPAASYVIKWTEGGAVITKTLTIAALSTDADLMIPIQPDNGTQITAQLTAISGTGTTVNVAAVVEQIA